MNRAAQRSPTQHAATDGLTSAAAAARLLEVGRNEIEPAHASRIRALLGKFWGVVPGMLELAVILNVVLGRQFEAAMIAALLVFNAVLGFVQESRAQRALSLLRARLVVNARVLRDAAWQQIPAAALVPDDVVRIRLGDIVPADVVLADGRVMVDQSTLTGESLAVERQAGEPLYSGALVTRGEATGLVTATGKRTFFGKTADLVRLAEAPRRFERTIVKIANWLGGLVIVLAAAVLAATLARGADVVTMLPFGLMLLVASVPVALPIMFTLSALLGARALAGAGVLITRLSAIEDAATMDVICLDKTGTITANRLAVGEVVAFSAATQSDVLRWAAVASDEATQDPIDLAVLRGARERGLLADAPMRLSFTPFDPAAKRTEATVDGIGGASRIIKGAPAMLAALAATPWSKLEPEVARLAADGSRVVAVATERDGALHVDGLIALSDPPRADSAALIADLRAHGVRVVLVTGDGEATARAVALAVGISGAVAPAGTLAMDGADVGRFDVFAGVFPEDKFRLIQALQRAGHTVGMTGDGVNDAPALRQAEVGIAVASATDVAKAAASVILTRPGLGEIIAAIDGSRRVYQRMQTFALTMITRKLAVPTLLAAGVVAFGQFVLTPLLMVVFMFLTDAATMALSADRTVPSRLPDRWAVRQLIAAGIGQAALLLAFSGAVYWTAANGLRLGAAETQTVMFVWLVYAGTQAVLYVTRVPGFFWVKPYPAAPLLVATTAEIAIVATLATRGWLMAPVAPVFIGGVLLAAVGFMLSADLLRAAATRWPRRP